MPDRPEPPALVLLHGCGGAARAAFEATGLVAAFQEAGRAPLALTLPGHGRVSPPHDPAAYADLAGLMDPQLPKGRLDGVGYSLGGKLLLELAIRSPGRFRRLVLGGVGDNVFAPERVAEAAASALEKGAGPDTPAPVRAFLDTFDPGANDALAIAAVLRRPPNPVFSEARLAAIDAEVLLVNGEDDPAAGPSGRLQDALRRPPQVLMLPGVGHFDLPADPAFVRAAVQFIMSPEGGAT